MISQVQHLSGEIYALHRTNNSSLTVSRCCLTPDECWVRQESASLPTTIDQRPVAFDVIYDKREKSVGIFLALGTNSSCNNCIQLFECTVKPLRILHINTCHCKELANSNYHTVFSGPSLAFIYDEILFAYSFINSRICKNVCEKYRLKDLLMVVPVLTNNLFVARSDHGIRFTLLQKEETFCSVPAQQFLPNEYHSLVQSIRLRVPNFCTNVWNALKENTTCICTSNKNFVVFARGIVRCTCTIPFGDVYSMQRHLNMFVLTSRSRGVCLLRNTLGKIQVHRIWNEAKVAFSGDFTGYGRKYLLLLSDREFSASSVIELFGYENKAPALTEHATTVVSALQNRLRIAQTALASAEDDYRHKQRLLDAVQWKMPRDSTLIALSSGKTCPMVSSQTESPVCITSFWYAVNGRFFTICWTAQCKCHIEDLLTHLVLIGQNSDYIQRLFWDGSNVKVIILAKMPMFFSPDVKATATVSWKIPDGCWQWKSFDIMLNISQVFANKPLFANALQKLECTRLAQQTFVFEMGAQQKTVEKILSCLPLDQILVPNRPKVYTFADTQFPLFGVNFELHKSSLQVYFKDNAQLMLFLHWFYDKMPEGLFLLPMSSDFVLPSKKLLGEELMLARERNVTADRYKQFRKTLFFQELKTDRAFCSLSS